MKYVLLLTLSLKVFAQVAYVYEGSPTEENKPFLYKVVSDIKKNPEGETQTVTYFTPENKAIIHHTLIYKNNALAEYTLKNEEYPITAKVTVKDKDVFFEYNDNGKTKTGKDDFSDNFVVGTGLKRYVENHIQDLKDGKDLKVRIGAPSRADTFTFVLSKVDGDEKEVKDGKWIKVKMKPSSIFIAALVKTGYYFLDAKTGETRVYTGTSGIYRPGNDAGFLATIRYE